MIVDALGNPLAFTLTAGQVHDITQAETLTAQGVIVESVPNPTLSGIEEFGARIS